MAFRKPGRSKTTRRVVSSQGPGRKQVRVDPSPVGHTSQRVRIAGTLGPIDPSDRSFTLQVEDETLRGSAEILPLEPLESFVGQTVVVSGIGRFRRSGSFLRVDADGIELAQGNVSFWSRVPRPILGKLDLAALRKPGSDWRTTIGQWPGSETDEEVLAALEELS